MAHKTTKAANPAYVQQLQQRHASRMENKPNVAAVATKFSKEPTKELCVGTIFPDCSELSTKWLDLQLRYLKASTSVPYEHFSVVQSGEANEYFRKNTNVLPPRKDPGKNSKAHVMGLETLRDFFVTKKPDYKYFLFIDMDAFPIRVGWFQLLTSKVINRSYELAVALRSENLEQRLHSSVLFVPRNTLPKLRWGVSKVGWDLIGGTETDVHLVSHQTGAPRNKSYVLLRSNKYQIHPLLCGVYYDLFYHHCCGSGRNFNMRGRPYWGHVIPTRFDVMKTIDDLMDHPNEFIGELVGWDKSEYAKV